jgi:hypothetical protein
MANLEAGQAVSLALFGQRLGRKKKGSAFRSLPSLRPRVGARVAPCTRRVPALPYPPHESHGIYHTFLPTLAQGDIPTLH